MPHVVVTARVYTDSSGVYAELPALLTKEGTLTPLLDYCVHRHHDRSLSWMRKLIHSVSLFLDYIEANPEEAEPWRLFRYFAQRLYTGTFNIETGIDPSNLCWEPRPWDSASYTIELLSNFFDWLGETNPAANEINPRYEGNAFDRKIDRASYLYRRNKAFLGHAWATNPGAEAQGRLTRGRRMPSVSKREPSEFPDDRFEELLFKGFKVRGRYDYRSMLITLLLHGAGFRSCEPFHLYVADVHPDPSDPSSALVLLHHPSLGDAPPDWFDAKGIQRKGNRDLYLASKWGMSPRNSVLGRSHAGWKNPRLDGKYYMRAWWFDPVYGKWFLQLWRRYMQDVALIDRNHPFAFINLDRDPLGGMYCLDSYLKAHMAAVLRVGLDYGKEFGTTVHGHRHSYAQRLKRADIDNVLRQRFLHHCSIESQDVYTQPTTNESITSLSEASARMNISAGGIILPHTLVLSN